MLQTERYRGLQRLKEFGVPIPALQVIDSPAQAETLELGPAAHGWTIRTCRRDGMNEQDLFYRNRLPSNQVKPLLIERFTVQKNKEFFIIYPSWSFRFSCNVIFSKNAYYFEGNYGSQKSIASGTRQPAFSFSVLENTGTMESKLGEITPDVLEQTEEVLSYLKRLPFEHFYTEVAYTREKMLVFFELWILGQARRIR